MIEVVGLKKQYGALTAVNGAAFQIADGESVALLGPNGAGKTTTVSMMVGLVTPDAGQVLFDGKAMTSDVDPLKLKLGFVPQELALYDELSAQANLELFGALYGLQGEALAQVITKSLTLVGLLDRAKDKAGTFSGGMKRRLNLAAALLHGPKLLILDEPTVGVDPQSRNAIFENLEALKKQGVALLYTTHYMEEAERLCDRIVIMDEGRVVADDTLRGLRTRGQASNRLEVELADAPPGPWLETLKASPHVKAVEVAGPVLKLTIDDLPAVLGLLAGQKVTHVASERQDLEQVFLSLTGKKLRDA